MIPMNMTINNVIQDPQYKYWRLDPIPSDEELGVFYGTHYYNLIQKGERVPELRRLQQKGAERQRELDWLRRGLYSDICQYLNTTLPHGRLLDVGCGSGDFVQFAVELGFRAEGIEPSEQASRTAQDAGLSVQCTGLKEYTAAFEAGKENLFDMAVLLNVLEHIPNPEIIMQYLAKLVRPGGIVCIRVPNDFSEIQLAAYEKLGQKPWWISAPDHVNYFNYETLRHFLGLCGFDVVHQSGDFPMELFLLMGENYTQDPEIGKKCHERRTAFETALPNSLRQRIYNALATAGVGRNCLVYAVKTSS
jgi:2-polyprenyl-3-methyl-5-hydroxy-6-metoxy-1,4-benzoquinol methylase